MIEINLLPGAARKSRRSSGGPSFDFGSFFKGIPEKIGDKYLLAAVVSSVIAIVALVGLFYQQSTKESALEEREQKAVLDSARYSAVFKDRVKATAARDSVDKQIAIIKSIDDARYIWPHILEEISIALPPYTWLTLITQTSTAVSVAAADTSGGKDKNAKPDSAKKVDSKALKAKEDTLFASAQTIRFRIQGQTVDVQALTRFMKDLEASMFIKNVNLARTNVTTADNKEVTEFQLDAESQVPPKFAIRLVPLTVEVK